jgi:hypothetical protein
MEPARDTDLELLRKAPRSVERADHRLRRRGCHWITSVRAVSAGASAVAAGSMFVYVGKHRAVMINYPPYKTLETSSPHG